MNMGVKIENFRLENAKLSFLGKISQQIEW